MTFAELILWCEDNSVNTESTDSQWLDMFRAARADLMDVIRVQKTATTNIVAGQDEYSLPSGYKTVHIVRTKESSDAEYKTIDVLYVDDFDSEGYKIWGNEIILQPKPSTNVTDGVKVYYWSYPAEITATTQTIDLPTPYLYGYYALAMNAMAGRELTVENRHYREYLKLKDQYSGMEKIKEPPLKMELI
jgi:hypothetical protein